MPDQANKVVRIFAVIAAISPSVAKSRAASISVAPGLGFSQSASSYLSASKPFSCDQSPQLKWNRQTSAFGRL